MRSVSVTQLALRSGGDNLTRRWIACRARAFCTPGLPVLRTTWRWPG